MLNDQLSSKRAEIVGLEIESVPVRYQPLMRRSFFSECSPRQAIKAKCVSCVGFEDVSNRIHDCTAFRCPLWTFRPFQDKGKDIDQDKDDASELVHD